MADGFTANWTIRANQFPRIIGGMEQKASMIVRKTALMLEAEAKQRAPVDTGLLRNSIQAAQVAPFYWRVTVGANYGVYVEWGTRFMPARPFLLPAANVVRPQFVEAMRTVASAA